MTSVFVVGDNLCFVYDVKCEWKQCELVRTTYDGLLGWIASRICLWECQVRLGRYHTYSLQYYVVYGIIIWYSWLSKFEDMSAQKFVVKRRYHEPVRCIDRHVLVTFVFDRVLSLFYNILSAYVFVYLLITSHWQLHMAEGHMLVAISTRTFLVASLPVIIWLPWKTFLTYD